MTMTHDKRGVADMHSQKITKIVSLMLIMLLVFGIFEPLGLGLPAVTAYAEGNTTNLIDGSKDRTNDLYFFNDDGVDVSFAAQIRRATNYMNRQAYMNLAPGEHDSTGGGTGTPDYSNKINMSNVGVFFSYTDGEDKTGDIQTPQDTITQPDSDSSVVYKRDAIDKVLKKHDNDGGTVAQSGTPGDYANYGLMLHMIGFDTVGSDAPETRRSLFGIAAMAAYYGASSVNALFEMMFNILDAMNPFQFFNDVNFGAGQGVITDAVKNANDAIGAGSGSGSDSDGAMGTLRTYISNIYNMFTEFAWAVAIPLAIIFIVVAFFLSRNGRASFGSNVKKILIRAVFLVIGIPIMGAAYTQVLSNLKDTQALSDDFITQAVSYTFLDFGAWVETSRLSPEGYAGNNLILLSTGKTSDSTNDGQPPAISASTWLDIRKACSDLNYNNGVFEQGDTEFLIISKKTGALLKDYIYDTSKGAKLSVENTESEMSTTNRQAVMTLITKYMTGEKYTAPMYASAVTAEISAKLKDKSKDNYTVGNLFTLSANVYSFSSESDKPTEGFAVKEKDGRVNGYYDSANRGEYEWGRDVAAHRFDGTGFQGFADCGNIWNNGGISGSPHTAAGGTGASAYAGIEFTEGNNSVSSLTVEGKTNRIGLDPSATIGFSTMSMFSYLTTKFDYDSFTCYGGAPSVYTQNGHYAVNLVGGDQIMQFAFFANMMAILGGYFLLAVFFVFRTAFEVVFKGFQLIGHALFAALGFYKSIGTVICMTVSMIAELFISVIFFSFMADIMFILTSIFDHFLADLFEKIGLAASGGMASLFDTGDAFLARTTVIASSFLATLVIIFFVSFAIRWRAGIMASLNAMIENIIGTLLGVQLSGASGGYMPGIAKAALNDTINIAKAGAAGAGAVALADGAIDMVNDIKGSAADTFGADGEDGENGEPNKNPKGENGQDDSDGEIGAGFEGAESNTSYNDVSDMMESDGQYFDNWQVDGRYKGDGSSSNAENDDAHSGAVHGGNGGSFDSCDNESDNAEELESQDTQTGYDGEVIDSWQVGNKVGSNDNVLPRADANAETAEVEETIEDKQSGLSFDMARGIVMTTVNEDGTSSDVALGLNGITTSSTDAEGNEQTVAIGKDGIQTTYEGADGTQQTVDVDTETGTAVINKTEADGTEIETVASAAGIVSTKTETAEDGSTRVTTTDSAGNQTIEEKNATTGYEAVTEISAEGDSVKTEHMPDGTTLVTKTDTEGEVTAQDKTYTDAEGNQITQGYAYTDDGSKETYTTKNGVTVKNTTDAEGNTTEETTYTRTDGSVVTATKSVDAEGNVTSENTVIISANGMDTLYSTESASGVDENGKAYTSQITKTNGVTTETRNLEDGSVVTIETDAEGDKSIITKTADGNVTIKETEAATGNVIETSISADGKKGTSITYSSDGTEIEKTELAANSDGMVEHATLTGGSVSMGTTGKGSSQEIAFVQSHGTGGSISESVNTKTGSTTTVTTDGQGSQSTANYDAKNDSMTVEYTSINGSTGSMSYDGKGNYSQNVQTIGGGSYQVTGFGTGDNAVETAIKTDMIGNAVATSSAGGRIERVEVLTRGSAMQQQAQGEANIDVSTIPVGTVSQSQESQTKADVFVDVAKGLAPAVGPVGAITAAAIAASQTDNPQYNPQVNVIPQAGNNGANDTASRFTILPNSMPNNAAGLNDNVYYRDNNNPANGNTTYVNGNTGFETVSPMYLGSVTTDSFDKTFATAYVGAGGMAPTDYTQSADGVAAVYTVPESAQTADGAENIQLQANINSSNNMFTNSMFVGSTMRSKVKTGTLEKLFNDSVYEKIKEEAEAKPDDIPKDTTRGQWGENPTDNKGSASDNSDEDNDDN